MDLALTPLNSFGEVTRERQGPARNEQNTWISQFREELVIKTRRLLVIDQNRETGEVLKAVLERRQTEVMSIRRWEDLPSLEPPSAATVLVLRGPEALVNHPEADRLGQLPRVVIGRVALGETPASLVPTETTADATVQGTSERESTGKSTLDPTGVECCFDDIFEYPELLNAIERLWNQKE